MLTNSLKRKSLFSKVTLSLLLISIGQSFTLSAVEDNEETGFFGSLCDGAKCLYNSANSAFNGVSSFVDNIDKKVKQTKRIIRYAKYAAYGVMALIGYKTVVKPTSNFIFGDKSIKATSFIDFGLKWSFIAAIASIPAICTFFYFNNKIDKIKEDLKNTKKELNQSINDSSDKTSAEINELKRDTENNHNAVMKTTSETNKNVKKILLNQDLQRQEQQYNKNTKPSAPEYLY